MSAALRVPEPLGNVVVVVAPVVVVAAFVVVVTAPVVVVAAFVVVVTAPAVVEVEPDVETLSDPHPINNDELNSNTLPRTAASGLVLFIFIIPPPISKILKLT